MPLKLGLDRRGMWLCQARGSKFQKGGRFTEVRSWDRGMNTDSVIFHISDICSKGTAVMVNRGGELGIAGLPGKIVS